MTEKEIAELGLRKVAELDDQEYIELSLLMSDREALMKQNAEHNLKSDAFFNKIRLKHHLFGPDVRIEDRSVYA